MVSDETSPHGTSIHLVLILVLMEDGLGLDFILVEVVNELS